MIHLQVEKCDYNIKSVLDALSKFEDDDFNGNNGDFALFGQAKAKGFTSNKDYVICELKKKYTNKKIKENIYHIHYLVGDYFYFLYGIDKNYYKDYDFKIDIDDNNIITIACACYELD